MARYKLVHQGLKLLPMKLELHVHVQKEKQRGRESFIS